MHWFILSIAVLLLSACSVKVTGSDGDVYVFGLVNSVVVEGSPSVDEVATTPTEDTPGTAPNFLSLDGYSAYRIRNYGLSATRLPDGFSLGLGFQSLSYLEMGENSLFLGGLLTDPKAVKTFRRMLDPSMLSEGSTDSAGK